MNIAITGEGIVSAIGLNKQEVLQSLLKKQSGIGKMKHLQSIHHELAVGEVDLSNEKMKEILGIPASQMMSRTALMGIIAIQQALDDANIIIDDIFTTGSTVLAAVECLRKNGAKHVEIAVIARHGRPKL